MNEVSNEVLLEKIENLLATVTDIKVTVVRLDTADRERIAAHVKLDAKADAAHRRIDILTETVAATTRTVDGIKDILPNMVAAYRVGIFILSALGLSLIGLMWSLITGNASIIFH